MRKVEFGAFTIAEVLIVMGIIGIIAQMTIPTLIQNVQEQETVVSLKKSYSNLSQAFISATNDNGIPSDWGLSTANRDFGNAQIVYNMLIKPYFKVLKDCGSSTGCFKDVNYKQESGTVDLNFNQDTDLGGYRFVSQDGMSYIISMFNNACVAGVTDCGEIIVDVNGEKAPNRFGFDTFWFYITPQKIVPWGLDAYNYSFDSYCKNKSSAGGLGCAAWVIYNGNLDYLHCSNLSWNGPTKCQ